MRLDRGLREGGGLELVLWIYRLLFHPGCHVIKP